MTDAVFKLSPGIQSYAWGKKGSASLAAQLGDVCVPDFKVDEGETYAEVRSSLYRCLGMVGDVNHGVTV